jgi:hypothetical protein
VSDPGGRDETVYMYGGGYRRCRPLISYLCTRSQSNLVPFYLFWPLHSYHHVPLRMPALCSAPNLLWLWSWRVPQLLTGRQASTSGDRATIPSSNGAIEGECHRESSGGCRCYIGGSCQGAGHIHQTRATDLSASLQETGQQTALQGQQGNLVLAG